MTMKMHVLDLGRLTFDANGIVGGSSYATVSRPNVPNKLVEVPVSSYCIEHQDGNVLFDVGCHPDAMGPDGRWSEFLQEACPHTGGEECQLPNRLQQIGLGPDDIRYVVLSHLHNDHAGCAEFFRKSHLIVHENEFAAALRTYGLRRDNTSYVRKDIARWCGTDLNWSLLGHDCGHVALHDEVEILNFGPGHAHGMIGLHVRLPETGSIILASDAIYSRANYEPEPLLPGECTDSVGLRSTVERIRHLAHRHKAQVWFGHDAEQFATLAKSTERPYF